MKPEFATAPVARQALGRVRVAFKDFETAIKAQIAQAIFVGNIRIEDRLTVSRELLRTLGAIQYALELCAADNGLPLGEYMARLRLDPATTDPENFVLPPFEGTVIE